MTGNLNLTTWGKVDAAERLGPATADSNFDLVETDITLLVIEAMCYA